MYISSRPIEPDVGRLCHASRRLASCRELLGFSAVYCPIESSFNCYELAAQSLPLCFLRSSTSMGRSFSAQNNFY